MPGFEINRKCPLSFSTALIYVAGCVVKYFQHGNDTVTGTVGATYITSCSADAMDS